MTDYRILVLTTIGSVVFILPHLALAQGFVPLTKIPEYTGTTDIGSFFNAAFRLGLIIAATLAVVMITLGGIEYMTTDSISKKSGGREKIQNAIIGLLIALLIWIILSTINPNLLKFNFKVPKPNGDNSALPGGGLPEGGSGGANFDIDAANQQDSAEEQAARNAQLEAVRLRCPYTDTVGRALCRSTAQGDGITQ